MNDRWVDANGHRLHFLEHGEAGAPPLVILPGITSPAITWDFVARELESELIKGSTKGLIGHLNFIHPNWIQVVGTTEAEYLERLDADISRRTLSEVASRDLACFMVAGAATSIAPIGSSGFAASRAWRNAREASPSSTAAGSGARTARPPTRR